LVSRPAACACVDDLCRVHPSQCGPCPGDPIALFQRAAAVTDAIVSAVRPDQFGHPTPCTEWTVRQLINHVLAGNLFFVSLATGAPPPDRTRTGQRRGGRPAQPCLPTLEVHGTAQYNKDSPDLSGI